MQQSSLGLCERRVKCLASLGKNTEFLETKCRHQPRKKCEYCLFSSLPRVKNQNFNIRRFLFSDPSPNSDAIETRH